MDAILLREVAAATTGGERIVVLDDKTGALVAGLAPATAPGGRVQVHCDLLSDEQRVRQVTSDGTDVAAVWHDAPSAALLSGATLVVLRLPHSLAALDELAEAVSTYAHPDVRLMAGGRVKHMSHGMNRVLLRHFATVSASLGQQKSRVLSASTPRSAHQVSYPRAQHDDELDLTVWAHGAAFAGSGVDAGTRLLASAIASIPSGVRDVVDLGCGTGVLATVLARQHPAVSVSAIDESAAACRSATATAAGNGCADRVKVRRGNALEAVAASSVDAVVCNPPFHQGAARDSDAARRMLTQSGRVLRPGGELWTVFNSHLPYLSWLRRAVGSTHVVTQNPRFTVTRSRKPS